VTWQIHIPYRERSNSLLDVAAAARELPTDDDRAVTRQIVLAELTDGSAASAGELLDKIEKASPAARRKMLDAARVQVGLPSTGDVEFRQQFELVNHGARSRAGNDHREARFALNEVGSLIDLNDQDDEIARAQADEESRRLRREDREAQQAVALAEARQHEQATGATFREQSRHQFPWQA
jgi:hypothetical protein